MFRVVVAGSRHFSDYDSMCRHLDAVLARHDDVVIISGTCRGADRLGERYAADRGYPVERFPADWDTHGKAAGPIRNGVMADNADAVCVFRVDNSPTACRGTDNMIHQALSRGLPLRVFHSVI